MSQGGLVDDFFSTIEEVGLTDIAKECGLALGPRDDGLMGGPSSSGLHADSQLSYAGGSSIGSPPRVHMPQCASVGPSVPAELQDMVSAAGGPRPLSPPLPIDTPSPRRAHSTSEPLPPSPAFPPASLLTPRPGVPPRHTQSPPRRRSGCSARTVASRGTRGCGTSR